MHRSLVLETNALRRQSREHPDGWGLAFYVGGQPQVARGVAGAFEDEDFESLCQYISSETVVAHVRKASVGGLTLENTHPFEYGPWVMAHNGTVPGFAEMRPELEGMLASRFREEMSGETDSERLFALFLTKLDSRCDVLSSDVRLEDVFAALHETVQDTIHLCHQRQTDPSTNIVVTNGRVMAAFRHGRTLFFSTHKSRCPERQVCRAFGALCEAPANAGDRVNHFLVASEIIGGAAVWREVPEDECLGVDSEMRFLRRNVSVPRLATVKTA
jgi:glutamine amidotransferase